MSRPPEYCSIKTVAEQLDCSVSTVTEYTNRGLLPQPYKKGSLTRWRWSEIEDAMNNTAAAEQSEQDPILRAINGG
jgi:predicted DNA-binding transcriptional regulator AlpA